MASIEKVLKMEIGRLARKEMKRSFPSLKQDLATIKRSVGQLNKKAAKLEKVVSRYATAADKKHKASLHASEEEVKGSRLSPRLVQKLRKRLRLSRKAFADLAGVSANTVYMWETGKTSPNRAGKAALVGLRKLRMREAKKLLGDKKPKKTSKKRNVKKRRKASAKK